MGGCDTGPSSPPTVRHWSWWISTNFMGLSFCEAGSGGFGGGAAHGVGGGLERVDADALDGVDELFVDRALGAVGLDHRLDHVRDLIGRERGANDLARHAGGRMVRAVRAAQGDLVPLRTVLVHAQDADVATVVVAAGVDATRNVQVYLADVVQLVQVLVTLDQIVGDGN